MRPLKEKISITIDGDLLEALREEAEKDDRSLSQYINLVLKKHIERTGHRNVWKNIIFKFHIYFYIFFIALDSATTLWYNIAVSKKQNGVLIYENGKQPQRC